MSRYLPYQLAALKRDNPVDELAGQWVNLRKGRKAGWSVGPCPLCSNDPLSKTAGRFECSRAEWVCAVCCDGGDVIRLLMQRARIGFEAAVAELGGVTEREPTAADARAAGRHAHGAGVALAAVPADFAELADAWRDGWNKARVQQETAATFRETERRKLFAVWRQAVPVSASQAEDYLGARGLLMPPRAVLRCAPDYCYFHGEVEEFGRTVPRIIHRGPAMLAAIVDNDGRFAGLHATWIDLNNPPKFKAVVADPGTGEVLVAKKSRGTTKGCHLVLLQPPAPTRLYLGEGIETVLTIYTALVRAGRKLDGMAFWTAIDLHNLGGPAAGTFPHPEKTHANGHRVRVPSSEPAYDGTAIAIPDSVRELVLLGDGDSDSVLTGATLARAEARYRRPGRRIATVMAPAGMDFNDLVMQREDAA